KKSKNLFQPQVHPGDVGGGGVWRNGHDGAPVGLGGGDVSGAGGLGGAFQQRFGFLRGELDGFFHVRLRGAGLAEVAVGGGAQQPCVCRVWQVVDGFVEVGLCQFVVAHGGQRPGAVDAQVAALRGGEGLRQFQR